MKILCTYPGRYGDLLWMLPTVRAIFEATGAQIDLAVAPKYRSICDLLNLQPYLHHAFGLDGWEIEETAPITPRIPPHIPAGYDRVLHLGYENWPQPTCARDIYDRAVRYAPDLDLPHLDLARPWIMPVRSVARQDPRVWLGWSEEHFELKVGITQLLAARFPEVQFWWIRPFGGRYDEFKDAVRVGNMHLLKGDWSQTARWATACTCYLGCLSSQWVLANALGVPCLAVEPNQQRWHPVFWSFGDGKNVIVRGNDSNPTFDARHIGDALEVTLEGLR